MNALELERIARQIIPPVGATMAIARVDEQLKHRAAFLIDGRIHGAPVGPSFDKPRDAIALVNLLNGETPRPRLDDSAGPGGPTSGDARVEPEAPSLGLGADSRSGRRCVVCKGPLPPGSRRQRRTCSGACRVALARSREGTKAAETDTDSPALVSVTVSAAPERSGSASTDPTASAAPSAHRLLGPARDARPDLSGIDPGIPTLGLL